MTDEEQIELNSLLRDKDSLESLLNHADRAVVHLKYAKELLKKAANEAWSGCVLTCIESTEYKTFCDFTCLSARRLEVLCTWTREKHADLLEDIEALQETTNEQNNETENQEA